MTRIACVLALTILASAASAQDIDLKSQQQVTFRDGKMFVTDSYDRETVKLDDKASAKIFVIQHKAVGDNQSCGQIADRYVRIGGPTGSIIDMPAKSFTEFASASNYFSKYRENWENLRLRKGKRLLYKFGAKGGDSLMMEGNRDDLVLSLKTTVETQAGANVVTVFSTKDLRGMSSFADAVNAVQKFSDTHKFEECL